MGPLACIKATNLERNAVARRCKGLRTSFAAQVNVPISEDITLMLKKGKIQVHRGKIISLIAPRSHVRLPRQIAPHN